MSHIITTRLVKIGNSQGIRIPKLLLEQVGLRGEIELQAEEGRLILRSAPGRRQGWDELFQQMAQQGDDRLLDADALPPAEWDNAEWTWEPERHP